MRVHGVSSPDSVPTSPPPDRPDDPVDVLPALISAPLAALALVLAPASAALPTESAPVPRAAGAPLPRGADWCVPLTGPSRVLRPFAPGPYVWLPGHRGVDLDAVRGTVVHAAGAGVVSFAGDLAGRGVVVIDHPSGLRTTYEPVDPLVNVGDAVTCGTAIAVVVAGDDHCGGPVPCLHWGLRRGTAYLDPMLLLDPGRPVLLPP